MGTGMPGGGGLRLKYSNPIHLDDVAADFPDMTIIIAHPSWPWQDEALSVCLHKPNVYIDLSGWSPKYFPPQLVQYANTQLKTKMLFGSDYPLITPDRWIKDFKEAGFKPEVHDLILKQNAIRALRLERASDMQATSPTMLDADPFHTQFERRADGTLLLRPRGRCRPIRARLHGFARALGAGGATTRARRAESRGWRVAAVTLSRRCSRACGGSPPAC